MAILAWLYISTYKSNYYAYHMIRTDADKFLSRRKTIFDTFLLVFYLPFFKKKEKKIPVISIHFVF